MWFNKYMQSHFKHHKDSKVHFYTLHMNGSQNICNQVYFMQRIYIANKHINTPTTKK